VLFKFWNPVGNQEVENIPDGFAPVHEEEVEDMAGDVVIERLFEFMREDGVVLIEHRQHLR